MKRRDTAIGDYDMLQTNYVSENQPVQALRGIAFLGIFFYHGGIFQSGSLGVSVFFVLSGFLLALKYGGKDLSLSVRDSFLFLITESENCTHSIW